MLPLAIWLLLPVVALVSLVLVGPIARADRVGDFGRAITLVEAAVLALVTLFLVAYVAVADDYRATGITRWEAYDAKLLTVIAVVAGAVCAAGLAVGAVRRHRRVLVASLFASVLAALLQIAAFIANTAN